MSIKLDEDHHFMGERLVLLDEKAFLSFANDSKKARKSGL